MNVRVGEKVHIVIRRNFDGDARRHFVGEVVSVDGVIARLTGINIIFDKTKNVFVQGKEMRSTIMNLAESGYIVNFIPENVVISELYYTQDNEKKMVITDRKSFKMDINEFGVNR